MVEEIVEEDGPAGDFDVKRASISWNQSKDGEAKMDATCWKKESVSVLQPCTPCTDFEAKAIKSNHCVSTGYFERVLCSPSGNFSLRPCTLGPSRHSLVIFFVVSLVLTTVTGAVAIQRRSYLENYAYVRVNQH